MRLALALFGEHLSPRFCFAPRAAIVDWDGSHASYAEWVELERVPYPGRLDLLANRGVTLLVCGSFPRERMADAARRNIEVRCGFSGSLCPTDDSLSDWVARLDLPPLSANAGERAPHRPGARCAS